jgi:acetyl esterase/lipase
VFSIVDVQLTDPFHDASWARLDKAPLPDPLIVGDLALRPGIVYSSLPGFRPLEMDLYAPALAWSGSTADEERRYPVVVWIHGGAFAMGSRRLLPEFLQAAEFFHTLARAGFVVAAIDYRLSSEEKWPAQLLDVRTAIRWLRSRAAELAIDVDAIAAWGESAGGHLAAMAGVLGRREIPDEPDGLDRPAVAAVIDWYGPTNFAAMDRQAPTDSAMSHDDPGSPESRLLGAPVQDIPALVAAADPATYADVAVPPTLIRHGRADRLVPFGQSVVFAEALRRAGAAVTFLPVDDAGHVFEGHPDPAVFVAEAIDFLHAVLPRSGPGQPEGVRT